MARVLSRPRTLTEQRRELIRERVWLTRIVPLEAALALCCATAASIQYWRQRPAAGWATAAAVGALLAIGHAWKIREDRQQSKRVRLGATGEMRVAAILDENLDERYVVFNDVVVYSGRERAQVDHLVLGPLGVVVVETKNWAGDLSGQADDVTWILRTSEGRTSRLANPILQNRHHCQVIRHRLAAYGLADVPVYSWIVLASPNVIARLGPPPNDVELLKLAELPPRCAALRSQPASVDAARIETMVQCFQGTR